MRVLAVSWRDLANPLAGGSEVMVDRLLSGLAARGHDVSLLCGGPVAARSYPVREAGHTYDQYLRAPLLGATRLRSADLVIDVSNGLPFFSPLWRRRPSVCLVLHNHADQWGTRFRPAVAGAARWLENHAVPFVYRRRPFVAISDSTAHALASVGIDRARITVIEPGVDRPETVAVRKATEPRFVVLARLVPHKRVDLVLEAWRSVQPITGGELCVVGDGPLLDTLRGRAAGTPGLVFTGRVSDAEKWQLLQEAWFLVNASLHEGWGLVVLEAAAAGTPTLALDASGVRDAIIDGRTGVLVHAAPEDSRLALAKAWIELASDRERQTELGRAARLWADRHDWEAMVDRWESFLRAELSGAGEGSEGRGRRRGLARPPAPVARGKAAVEPRPQAGHARRDRTGLRRMSALLRGFRTQFDDPDGFYSLLASDTIDLIGRYEPVDGSRVVDIGGGPGYLAEAFREAGAHGAFIEPFWDEMTPPGRQLGYGIVGDGCRLPLLDGSFDISCSSNVIEHVVDPNLFLDEMLRVVRPGGLVFLAFTNWLSPFGGHETSPWHYLGGERAAQRYERKNGFPPKNRFGESLYELSISRLLKMVRERTDVVLEDAFPRYYPGWSKPIVRVPGVREVVTWNLTVVLRRSPTSSNRGT